MEQELGSREKGVGRYSPGAPPPGNQGVGSSPGAPPPGNLKEIDRLRLERLNLSISNLNLQLALLNERARALHIETAGFRAEREGLVKGITAGYELDGKWRLNPDAMIFEAMEAELAPAHKEG